MRWLSFSSPTRLAKSSPLFVVPSTRSTTPSEPSSVRHDIQIPKYVDTITPHYKHKSDALLVELKEAEEKSLKESERLEKEVAEVKEMKKKISTMTANLRSIQS